MDRRKTLGIPQVENLRSPSGSLRRRSSIALQTCTVELGYNDDEAERAALRLETNNVSVPSPPSANNRRSINFTSVIGDMSSPQIIEGITECIKLSTQNKINMKNAFSLNMIDFMSYLVRNRDEGIANLQVAGTSLDVSAKIYALRVDVLHQDILQMAGNLDHKDKKDNTNDNNEVNIDQEAVENNDNALEKNSEQIKKKKKKKKTSQKILTTIDALLGDVDDVVLSPVMFGEADCQTTDMLYQAMLPQHCGIGLGLHPYKDIILDECSTVNDKNPTDESQRLTWPQVQFDTTRQIFVYPNFEFINWSSDQEIDNEELNLRDISIHEDLAFDLDASLPADNEEFNGGNFYDNDENEEDNAERYANTRRAEAIVDLPIIDRVPDKKMDYSFFSDAVNVRYMGPAYWKIKGTTKQMSASRVMEACRQGAGRKKKEVNLVFDNDDMDNCDASLIVPVKNKSKLLAKTARLSWLEKKLELLRDNNANSLKKICRFDLRANDILNFTKNIDLNTTVLSDESGQYDYDNENDTNNYCPNIDNDDIQTGDTSHEGGDNNLTGGGFIGDNLIEAPKLTQKIFIPFSQRAKKLDMRKLKKCIWNCLLHKDQNEKGKENIEENEKNDVSRIKNETKFSDVVAEIPRKLSNHDAEELSFAIAFVSLLHLANEKTLKISSTNDYSDVIVSQD